MSLKLAAFSSDPSCSQRIEAKIIFGFCPFRREQLRGDDDAGAKARARGVAPGRSRTLVQESGRGCYDLARFLACKWPHQQRCVLAVDHCLSLIGSQNE